MSALERITTSNFSIKCSISFEDLGEVITDMRIETTSPDGLEFHKPVQVVKLLRAIADELEKNE